jgi:hypothetical protein
MTQLLNKLKKRESGSMISHLAGVFMMVFIFVMILVMAAYGRIVQIRIAVDTTCKSYLYIMEQHGYLDDRDGNNLAQALKNDLIANGCTSVDLTGTDTYSASGQVAYGDKLHLIANVTFHNPLYDWVSTERMGSFSWFTVMGIPEEITYNVDMPATSKW